MPSEIVPTDNTRLTRIDIVASGARTDMALITSWLATHAQGSRHTFLAYERIGHRFLAGLTFRGVGLATASLEHVRDAIEEMGIIAAEPAAPATAANYAAAIKSLLRFGHRVGYLPFDAGQFIKIRKAPRRLSQRILGEVDTVVLIRSVKSIRNRVLLDVAYCGGLRVSELSSLTWDQVILRDNGEVQLSLIGKGDKERNVLLPASIGGELLRLRGESVGGARAFAISVRRINYIIKAACKRSGINPKVSAHWLRHAHASHALDNGAPVSLVSQTLGHASIKTTSIYSHARPNDSSSRYIKR